MKKNRVRGCVILAIILIAFSIIVFAIPFSKNPVFWLAYAFAVVSILSQIYIFNIAFAGEGDIRSKLYGFPIARVGVIYLIVQLIISLVEMVFSTFLPVWVAVILNILLVAFASIGCIATDTMRDEIIRQDTQLKKDVSNMRALQSMSATLVGQCVDSQLKQVLQNLADEFKYSDPVSAEQTIVMELELQQQMQVLQSAVLEGDNGSIKILCGKILASLAERNRVCSLSK